MRWGPLIGKQQSRRCLVNSRTSQLIRNVANNYCQSRLFFIFPNKKRRGKEVLKAKQVLYILSGTPPTDSYPSLKKNKMLLFPVSLWDLVI